MLAKLRFYIRRFFCKRNKFGLVKDDPTCMYCLKYAKCYPVNDFYEDELDF
ncbi:hypothetical protein LCGC14_1234090, partial [marine sediment metagenome]